MANFFIDRPIFAWVVALFIIIAGGVSLTQLPINQYPRIGAPTITINTIYPGASAQIHEDTVLSLIERQMNGIEGLDYMSTEANANGTGNVTLTFKSGTDDNIAQINVQNALSIAEPRLPQAVRDNGIRIEKAQNNIFLFVMLSGDADKISLSSVSDYTIRNIKPEIQRLTGIGNIITFGSERALRIWLDPDKMRSYNIHAGQVASAIRAQNIQIPAGTIGALPSTPGQAIYASITAPAQLTNVNEFNSIVVKSTNDGATVRLADIARVELGLQNYSTQARLNGQPAVGMGVQLSNDGNAVAASQAVHEKMAELEKFFPEGMKWDIPYDTSLFVNISIQKVLLTLLEAIGLVFIVMLLFLQNIRYTLIPTTVVPISLLGALVIMSVFAMSINVLTMFAMVLVIGIVVDDAIVVVENVERLMAEEGLSPREAAHKGMTQITGAVIGITIVLISVFVPLAFFPGASGNIYRQFSIVMVASIGFSAFLALSLTPALCATLLKPVAADHHEKRGPFGWFNRFVKATTRGYESTLKVLVRGFVFMMLVYAALAGGVYWIYKQLPGSFLPQEDQGYIVALVQLPSGATQERTRKVMEQIETIALQQKDVKNIITVLGFSFGGQAQNMGLAFLPLTDWSERLAPGQHAGVLSQVVGAQFFQIRDAFVYTLSPPPIPELGNSSGFNMRLQDRGNVGHEELINARNILLGMSMQSPKLSDVRPDGLEDAPQLKLNINRDAVYARGVDMASVAGVIGAEIGSAYLNDFPNQGRMQRVIMMAEPDARMQASDIGKLTIPNNRGDLVPLSELVTMEWIKGPVQLRRYNGYPSVTIGGSAAPGFSSGDAMLEMEGLVKKLPPGIGMEWTGQSLEEKRAGAISAILYGFSILSVFLCLAALYNSWSIPFAVLLVVPLGFFGVVLGINYRDMANDVYFQVGLITVIGLSAKNAILIVAFAKDLQEQGRSIVEAVLEAAHLRFRPIIMTSFAFIVGVIPLYTSVGASSASQRAIGTSVLWGMLIGTLLSVFFVPIFYVLVSKLFSKDTKKPENLLQEVAESDA